jgi:hypothetical protein
LLAFGRGGPGRVAEHAVGAHGPHALLPQHRHDLADRPELAWFGRVQVHRVRVKREHDRGLGPAGVRVPAGQPGVPGLAGASLVAQPAGRCLHRRDVPAVPVDQQHGGPVQAGVPPQLDQAGGQGLLADGQRAGEGRMLTAGADGEGRGQRHAGTARTGPPGQRHGDPGVGVQRQVRAVLLQRAGRYHQQPPRAFLHLRPPHPGQLRNGRCRHAAMLRRPERPKYYA